MLASHIYELNVIAKDEKVLVKGKIVSISWTKKVAFRGESCEKTRGNDNRSIWNYTSRYLGRCM